MLSTQRATLVILLVAAMIMPTPQTAAYPRQSSSAVSAGFQAEQLLSDVELTATPNVTINGTASGEFSWNHWALPEDGILTLNWTHTPGTVIHMRPQDDYSLPDSLDFIYFSQSFEWTGDGRPNAAQVTLNASLVCTGSFDPSEAWMMFGLYVWLINPSGAWERIVVGPPSIPGSFTLEDLDLGYLDIVSAFSSPGNITFAIGLSPLRYFMSYGGSEPYQSYSGSVVASFSQLRLDVLVEDDDTVSELMEPLFNETYGFSIREILPDAPEEYANASDYFVEMATDDHGMIYVLVNSRSHYPYGYQNAHSFAWETVLKYDPQLNLVWTARNTNLTSGHDIEVAGRYIYTTGRISEGLAGYDAYVTKWTLDGDRVWDAFWSWDVMDIGLAVAVAANDSVYVSVLTAGSNPVLLKLDSNGNLLWNRTCIEWESDADDIELVDGNLLLFTGYYVRQAVWLNSSFMTEDIATANAFAVDDAGSIYTCSVIYAPEEPRWGLVTGRSCVIEKMDHSGDSLWNYTFAIVYSDIWYETLVPISLTPLRDGSLVVLIGGYHSSEYYLVVIGADGKYLRHWSIFGSPDLAPRYVYPEMSLCSTDSGLVYLASTVDDPDTEEIDTRILTYGLYLFQSDLVPMIVAGATGVGILNIVAALWYVKRKPKPVLEGTPV